MRMIEEENVPKLMMRGEDKSKFRYPVVMGDSYVRTLSTTNNFCIARAPKPCVSAFQYSKPCSQTPPNANQQCNSKCRLSHALARTCQV